MSEHDTQDQGESLAQLAAEMTGTVGMSDEVGADDAVPNAVADDVEAYEDYAAQSTVEDALEDDTGEVIDPGKGRKHVPLGALQEERGKRQLAQAEAEALRQQIAAFQAQLQFAAQQQAQQEAEAAIPAFDEDPEGHVAAKFAQLQQQQLAAQQMDAQRQQFEAAVGQIQRESVEVGAEVTRIEAEFVEQHPDYRDAYDFLNAELDVRVRQQHPYASEQEHGFAKQLAVLSFVKECTARGDNPAALIYNKARELGFQANNRVPAVRQKPPTSLSNLSGAGRAPDERGKVDAKAIANMSNDEFDRFFDSMRSESMQRPAF